MRYTILILVFFVASCKKYLAKKPNAVLAVPTTVSDLQAVLDNSQYNNEQRTPSYMETSADDYFMTPEAYESQNPEYSEPYRWARRPYRFTNDWSYCSVPVYHANFCLEQLQKLPEAERQSAAGMQVEGSARFFRAYYFLQLLWQHAKAYDASTAESDSGIPLRLGSDFNLPSVRASVEESYRQVIADAVRAAELLPDLPHATMFRPSKAAAYGLLARTYLSMRKYDSAGYFADRALAIKDDLMDLNNETPTRFNKETIFYTEMNQLMSLHVGYMSFIDTVLMSTYAAGDLRLSKEFSNDGAYFFFSGNYTGDPYLLFTGIATDELWLTRAESRARAGDVTGALDDLNTLLEKRWDSTLPFIPVTAADGQEALSIILLERRKELLMRGLRWIDIKRLNLEGAGIIPKRIIEGQLVSLQPNASTYALPLPVDIIEITGMPQN